MCRPGTLSPGCRSPECVGSKQDLWDFPGRIQLFRVSSRTPFFWKSCNISILIAASCTDARRPLPDGMALAFGHESRMVL